MKHFLFALLITTSIPFFSFAETYQDEYQVREFIQEEPIKTPQEIQLELDANERLFKEAQEMFNPWYSGPLLTGGAHMMPPGSANIQPYLFVTDNYAVWNSKRKSVNIPDRWVVNPSITGLQFGLTDWLDMIVALQGFVSWQSGKHDGGFGDTLVGVGFPILKEDLKRPAIKFVFNEIFPTGKYQRLSPRKFGLDGAGSGSFQSQFGLRISKLFFWSRKHPVNLRALYSYTIPSSVSVRNFNAYGGGFGTAGKVRPGNSQQVDAAMEYSFTQKWVVALDAVYVWANKTTFHGTAGTTSTGSTAAVGGGYSDQLSFAPAIEYNPTANLNFLAGVWFDVYGRNTSKFVSGVISMSLSFNVSRAKD